MVELDIPEQDGMKLHGENIGCIVAWRKRYISFDSESDSDDDDADGRGDLHPPTSAPERNPNLPPQRESSPQTDTSPLPQRDTSLLLQTDQSYSPPQKARKINSSHRIGLSQKEASKATAKKKLSASISSPIKGKEKQEVKKAKAAEKAKAASVAEHFLNMALVPQTGNP